MTSGIASAASVTPAMTSRESQARRYGRMLPRTAIALIGPSWRPPAPPPTPHRGDLARTDRPDRTMPRRGARPIIAAQEAPPPQRERSLDDGADPGAGALERECGQGGDRRVRRAD